MTASGGQVPGMGNRWNAGKDMSWEPLRAELVAEVAYDHMQGDRFRHATHFVRWRPDRDPGRAPTTNSRSRYPKSWPPSSARSRRSRRPRADDLPAAQRPREAVFYGRGPGSASVVGSGMGGVFSAGVGEGFHDMPFPLIEHPRARFWFTVDGWKRYGRHVHDAAVRRGHVVRVIRRKNPRSPKWSTGTATRSPSCPPNPTATEPERWRGRGLAARGRPNRRRLRGAGGAFEKSPGGPNGGRTSANCSHPTWSGFRALRSERGPHDGDRSRHLIAGDWDVCVTRRVVEGHDVLKERCRGKRRALAVLSGDQPGCIRMSTYCSRTGVEPSGKSPGPTAVKETGQSERRSSG